MHKKNTLKEMLYSRLRKTKNPLESEKTRMRIKRLCQDMGKFKGKPVLLQIDKKY